MESITVRILNFERFNPRTDVKRPSWFRLDHGMIDDPEIYMLDDAEFRAWIYVLSMASKKNADGVVRIFFDHAHRACGVSKKAILGLVGKLEQLQVIPAHVTSTNANVTDTNVNVTSTNADGEQLSATDVRTDEQTERISPEDLRKIWNDNRGSLPACTKISGKRARAAQLALASEPDPNYWAALIRALAASPWHNGTDKANTSGWVADFDFLLQKDKHVTLYERLVANAKPKPKLVPKEMAEL